MASPWNALYDVASTQDGFFSVNQAVDAGCSQQLLGHYVASNKVERIRRAVYRIVQFPRSEQEDLIVVWLWSKSEGVFSHETALRLHEISDALPTNIHLTLPEAWRVRSVTIPENVIVHYDDVGESDRAWVGTVPITKVHRTLVDCFRADVSAEIVAQASREAADRGVVSKAAVIAASTIDFWRYRASS